MRLPILVAGLTLPLASAAAQSFPEARPGGSPDQRECYGSIIHYAEEDKKAVPKRLGELPPGNLILSVVRDVAGCQKPVIVRYGIGAGAPAEASASRLAPVEAPRPRAKLIR